MSSPDPTNPTKIPLTKIAKPPSAARAAHSAIEAARSNIATAGLSLIAGDRTGAAECYRLASDCLSFAALQLRLAAVQVEPCVDPSTDSDTDSDDAIRAERSISCLDQIESEEDYIAAFGDDTDGGAE